MHQTRTILLAVASALLGLFAVFGAAAPAMASTPAHATQPVAHSAITNGSWPASFRLVAAPKGGMSRTSAMLNNQCGATVLILLSNDNSENVIGAGVGNAAIISNTTANNWTIHCPTGGMSFFNGSGHCLALATNNANSVVITSDSTPCSDDRRLFGFLDSDQRGDWIVNDDNGPVFGYNVFVFADASGEELGTENSTSFWTNWCSTSAPDGMCFQ